MTTETTAPTTASILAPVAAITLPDSAQLTNRAQNALAFVQGMAVVDGESYELAAEELLAIKARATRLEAQRTSITKPMNDALRAVNALFKPAAELLEQAERAIKGKLIGYDAEQAAIRAERQRKADELAAAERTRLAAAAAELEAAARKQAEAAAAAQAAGDLASAEIATAAAQRAHAEAANVATEAQLIVAAPPAIGAPVKVAGLSTSKKVTFTVENLHELIVHVAAHPELEHLLAADLVRLRNYVTGLGLKCQLPGVRVYEDTTMSARRK
jgi:DNA-directed RNA polymerase subunit F